MKECYVLGVVLTATLLLSVVDYTQASRGEDLPEDKRRTRIRASFGINFERVDYITIEGGTSTYSHTFTQKWPNLDSHDLTTIRCEELGWGEVCRAINQIITEANLEREIAVDKAKGKLRDVMAILPPFKGSDLVYETVTPTTRTPTTPTNTPVSTSYSAKTMGGSGNTAPVTVQPMDRLPPATKIPVQLVYQKESEGAETATKVLKYLGPGGVISLAKNLFEIPSGEELERLRKRVRVAGEAEYTNAEAIVQFHNDISSLVRLEDGKLNNVKEGVTVLNEKLERAHRGLKDLLSIVSNTSVDDMTRIQTFDRVYAIVLTNILPAITEHNLLTNDIALEVDNFMKGIVRLTEGYISPYLVSATRVKDMIRVIKETLKSKSLLDLKLPSEAVSFFYLIQDVTYMHTLANESDPTRGTTLTINLDVPLYKKGGRFPLYRLDTFPVPIRAGMDPAGVTHDQPVGFTTLTGVPDFIAVTPSEEVYIEMSKEVYLSCKGQPQAKICHGGVESLRKRRAHRCTCAYAIFVDRIDWVVDACTYAYEETGSTWRPPGQAVQLKADSSFMMQASQTDSTSKDVWSMTCPLSTSLTHMTLDACDMCRLKVPCFCSVSGRDFQIPPRFTGCTLPVFGLDTKHDSSPTYIHHLNAAASISILPKEARQNAKKFAELRDKFHEPLAFPSIHFETDVSTVRQAVKKANVFSSDLQKIMDNIRAGDALYKTEADALANKTQDFSSHVAGRTTDLSAAFYDFFSLIFGDNVVVACAVIFSPLTILVVSFILVLLVFLPKVVRHVIIIKRDKVAKETMKLN